MVGTKHDESKRPFLTVAKKEMFDGCKKEGEVMAPAVVVVVVVVVVVGATNNADGWQKKNSPDAPGVPDQTCTYRFLAGRCSQKRAGRKRGHPPPLVVSAADTRAGDGWRRFFRNAPPDQTCTHL